jgi:hypothetical protein
LLLVAGLLAYVLLRPTIVGFWIFVGVGAAICHRYSARYWVASIAATVLTAALASAIAVMGVLTFDPFFTGWADAAEFFVTTMCCLQALGLPVTLLIGLLFRRARNRRPAAA